METIKPEYITRNNLLCGIDTLFSTTFCFENGAYVWCIENSGNILRVSIPKDEIDKTLEYVKKNVYFNDDFCLNDKETKQFEKIVQSLYGDKEIQIQSKNNTLNIKHASQSAILAFLCYVGNKHPTIKTSCIFSHDVNRFDELCSLIDLRSIQTKEILQNTKSDLANVILYLLAKKHGIYYIDTVCELTIRDIKETEIIIFNDVIESYRYRKEPLRFYLQAFSFTHPMMRYLAFYHVVEFFLGNIQEQRAIKIINNELQNESWKNDTDHRKKIYKKINEICLRRAEVDQLHDCFESFLSEDKISSLFDRIDTLQSGSEVYYSENKVFFATAEETRIARNQTRTNKKTGYEITIDRITLRIYKTRNYFIHSKDDNNKGLYRYEPFEHDSYIERELPLIQAIAEVFLEANRQSRNYNTLF